MTSKGSEVGAIYELHGEEEGSILGRLQVARIDHIFVANLAQGADLAQEAGGEGLIAGSTRKRGT